MPAPVNTAKATKMEMQKILAMFFMLNTFAPPSFQRLKHMGEFSNVWHFGNGSTENDL